MAGYWYWNGPQPIIGPPGTPGAAIKYALPPMPTRDGSIDGETIEASIQQWTVDHAGGYEYKKVPVTEMHKYLDQPFYAIIAGSFAAEGVIGALAQGAGATTELLKLIRQGSK